VKFHRFKQNNRAARAWLLNIASAVVVTAVAIPAAAEQCIDLENFSASTPNSFPAGWTPREDSGRSVYVVAKEGDKQFIRARASGAKSAGNGIEADRSVKWNIDEYPILRWQWRPNIFPKGANEESGKDDSALGVYIGFCPPEDLQLCERSVKGQLGLSDRIALPRLFFNKGVGSLKYIWSESLAKGFEFDKGRKAVKVLASGVPANPNQWVDVRVDVRADYRRRFGAQKALNPIGLSILTDADDTQSVAAGDYADFKLCRE
jgi:DUF3047 family protein